MLCHRVVKWTCWQRCPEDEIEVPKSGNFKERGIPCFITEYSQEVRGDIEPRESMHRICPSQASRAVFMCLLEPITGIPFALAIPHSFPASDAVKPTKRTRVSFLQSLIFSIKVQLLNFKTRYYGIHDKSQR